MRKMVVSAGISKVNYTAGIPTNELLTSSCAVIRKGIYTLQHLLENILACYWHFLVPQQPWYRSGQSLHHCRAYTMVKDRMLCWHKRIQ